MILLVALIVAGDPAPMSLDPFRDERDAAVALERQMNCLGGQMFDRRHDSRAAEKVAAAVVEACHIESSNLRGSLVDVYRRKPNLMPAGLSPEQAADLYVNTMNARTSSVIEEGRRHK